MLRGLILGALAVGVGMFAASLLRSEGRATGETRTTPPTAGACTARTRSGAPCRRPAEPGSDRCWQHG